MEIVWQATGPSARKRISQDECFPSFSSGRLAVSKAVEERRVRAAARPAAPEPESGTNTRVSSPRSDGGSSPRSDRESSPGSAHDSSPRSCRAIDYIPEVVLADLSNGPEAVPGRAERPTSGSKRSPHHRSPVQQRRQSQSDTRRAQRQLVWYYRKHRPRNAPVDLSDNHRRYLEDVGALLELPKATTDGLLSIYISLLDDLIPLLDGSGVFRGHSNGQSSVYLIRAMCLVACKTKQAAPFLRLRDDGPLLPPLEFASTLLSGLDAAIKADLEPDRITKVQILALMHLHNDGITGTRRSSSYLSQAICEAWSLSLHFNIPGNAEQQACDFLWWTLRNFDRLNKPIMAAGPFIIDDSDVGIERIAARKDHYRSQIMAIATALGDLMATATKVFKATSTATVDDLQPFPTFSEITAGANLDLFHRSHSAYLEIWYCVAAMLSCRYSGPGSTPYQRRFDAANRVLDIISDGRHESLPPLPLVPYAMSMSTTMIYRALRDNQLNVTTAYRSLSRCCDALDALSPLWTSVTGVTKLAKRLLGVLAQPETRTDQIDAHDSTAQNGGEPAAVALGETNHRPSAVAVPAQFNEEVGNMNNVMVPPSASWQPYPGAAAAAAATAATAAAGQPSDPRLDFDRQLAGEWTGNQGAYSQLDAAFHDLFDYGMPNVIRDQQAWEFLQATSDDGNPVAGDFQVPPCNSSSNVDFSYGRPLGNGYKTY
ncbi:hypothetical protein SPI_04851 [Niveomyces insectorum RCEF 264]|uniref:Fungal specific transcription factor n=1 Tax=Niveomyces insectorum RCEF 264 TaxID=1081102 RepID=A0A167UWZ3_9HYPO|nr:hypothetical protein SPI_04851 [Niveomyces insectorum RCEF 264]